MKYLVSCFLLLPLITSCVEQDLNYDPNYNGGSSAHVEVHPVNPTRHFHENNGQNSSRASDGRVYHEHSNGNQDRVRANQPAAQVQSSGVHNNESHKYNVRQDPPLQDDEVITHGHH
jgi:hypothetical protein